MALTGEVSDLSLSEVIELFCNRRKSGRLTVDYPQGVAQLYLKSGAIVHATFEELRGVEAVHYALSLSNASFNFYPDAEAPEHSIDLPWASVVLDGLRRIDEGVLPVKPSSNGHDKVHMHYIVADEPNEQEVTAPKSTDDVQAFGVLLSQFPESGAPSRRWFKLPVVVAIVLIVLGIGVPWGWYTRHKAGQIRRKADDAKRFEHLYAPTDPTPQPTVTSPTNEHPKTSTEKNQEASPSPEQNSSSRENPR